MLYRRRHPAQYTTDKVVGQKHEALRDSLEKMKYPYLLPIWGQKVVSKGYNLPYSAGLSVQYLWQELRSSLINNLQVGFNNGPKYNLDEIIRFPTDEANVRPAMASISGPISGYSLF